jgi:crotonobetainyl-CoA:carnitine CoA-transferase CaiB-like acyl-CoA transferase
MTTLISSSPLSGIRVLDLSRVLAGPVCTMMLGDLGADVLKVERPKTGDDSRSWGPPFDGRGQSAYFLSVNRNKYSAALDLESPDDCAMIRRLAHDADVVVENFKTGTLERRSLGARALLEANSRLIWCTISGFGDDSDRPGYDFVVQAEAGWMAITGEPGGAPMKAGVALVDVIAGKDAAIAVLAALAARGLGTLGTSTDARHLKVSLLHSATAALVNVAQNSLVSGDDAKRWGNAHANLTPYELFATADGSIVVAVGSDAQWISCVRALGLDELANDESLRTNPGRIVRAFSAKISTDVSAHWMSALQAAGVPCGVVKRVPEVLRAVDASAAAGVYPLSPGRIRFVPPMLDEHGAAIRARGWDAFTERNG